jgi:limonene-1,2-epoxide hydrolase
MYTPQTQEELGDTIQAAIEINHSLNAALESLKNDDYPNAYEAWIDTVYPAQRKWSDRGASDTEGRERAADWLESHGFDWE